VSNCEKCKGCLLKHQAGHAHCKPCTCNHASPDALIERIVAKYGLTTDEVEAGVTLTNVNRTLRAALREYEAERSRK
jgi:hypothetical protein